MDGQTAMALQEIRNVIAKISSDLQSTATTTLVLEDRIEKLEAQNKEVK